MSDILAELKVLLGADSTELTGAFDQTIARGAAWQQGMTAITAAVGAAFAGMGAGAFAAANKFEEAGVSIQRATGAIGAKLEGLEESFKNVYTQTAKSADQVSAALGLISTRTGQTGKDLEALTLASLKLSNVQKEDVSTVVKAETQLFGAWSIATNKQVDAVNFLRVAAQQTGTSVSKLTEFAATQAPVMKALGYNWEQTVAMIGSFDKAGLPTEKVFAGLGVVLKQFAKDGVQDTAVAWQALVAKVRDGSVTFDDFLKKYGGKSGTYLFQAIKDGKTDVDALAKSFEDMAAKGVDSAKTLKDQYTQWLHSVEALIAPHKDLLVMLGLIGASGAGAVIGGIFKTAYALIGPALAKLELFVLNLGKMSTDYDVMLSTGILSAVVWTGLAVAIGLAAKALWDLSNAKDMATGAINQRDASLARLEANLRSRGADINAESKSYHGGGYGDVGSDAAYANYLRDLQRIGSKLPTIPIPAGPNDGTTKPNGGGLTGAEATPFNLHEDTISDALAVLNARYEQALSMHKKYIAEIAESGLTIDAFWEKQKNDAAMSALAFDDLGNAMAPQKSIFEGMAPSIDKCDKLLKEIGTDVNQANKAALDSAVFGQLASAARHFGITTTHVYEEAAKTAVEQFDIMLKTGQATEQDLAIAALKTAQAEIDADYAAGRSNRAQHDEDARLIKQDLATWQGAEDKKKTALQQALDETNRLTASMFSSIERGIASSIVHWKGFGAAIKGIFQKLGEDVLTIMLHALLQGVEAAFAKVLAGLVTKLLVFFGITKATASITDAAQVTGQAGVGGAGAAAAAAPLFWWAPEIAVAIGAAMAGSIEGAFAPLALFHSGGDVPFDMLAGLKTDEMVLPTDISRPLRSMIASQGAIGGGGGVSFHNCTFSGVTKDLVKSVFSQGVRQARLQGMTA
jgi:Phage-related minor tail protein